MLAAVTNLIGALWGTAVAKTISSGLIDSRLVNVTPQVLICALLGAIVWNLDHVVVGLAVEFHPRAGRRPVRRGARGDRKQLASIIWSHARPDTGGKAKACSESRFCRWSSRRRGLHARLHHHGLSARACCRSLAAAAARSVAPRVRASSTPFSAKAQIVSSGSWVCRTARTTRRKRWASSRWRSPPRPPRALARRIAVVAQLPARRIRPAAAASASRRGSRSTCALVMAAGTAAGGWRIIQDARPQDGEAASDQRLRRRNQLVDGDHHWRRTSAFRFRRRTTFPRRSWASASPKRQRDPLDRRRTHGLGVDSDDSDCGIDCLCVGRRTETPVVGCVEIH